jgi:hypothetical protein
VAPEEPGSLSPVLGAVGVEVRRGPIEIIGGEHERGTQQENPGRQEARSPGCPDRRDRRSGRGPAHIVSILAAADIPSFDLTP